MATGPKAMISSAATTHAERTLLAARLERLFDKGNITLAPERSAAGSATDAYLNDAGEAHFLVVLLTQETRPAVFAEIQAALKAGAHVAAFSLRYPPYLRAGEAWTPTPEEVSIRDNDLFVRDVSSIVSLERQVDSSMAHLLAKSAFKLRIKDFKQNYDLANEWLSASVIKRVALVQQTSLLALGPRKGERDESRSFQLFEQVLKAASGRAKARPQFVHVLDLDLTAEEAELNGDTYVQGLAPRRLETLARSTNPRLHFAAVGADVDISPLLVVNDNVAISYALGHGGTQVIVTSDARVADEVMDTLVRNPRGTQDLAIADYFQTIADHLG